MEITCQNPECGETFDGPRRRKFCSLACSQRKPGQWKPSASAVEKCANARRISPKMGHPITFVCDWCRQSFVTYASKRKRPHKFCTRACGTAYNRRLRESDVETLPQYLPQEGSD